MNRIRSKQSFRFNQHPILLQTAFANFAQLNQFCDVTIVCENGEKMQAHRTMLAACSMYFEKCLLNVSMDRETYIILKDCHYNDMQLIIEFIYNGSVHVEEGQLTSLQKTAESLQIKSLPEAIRKYVELCGTGKENPLSQNQISRTKLRALSLSRLSLNQSSPISDSEMSEPNSSTTPLEIASTKIATPQTNSLKKELINDVATNNTNDVTFKWWNVTPKVEPELLDQNDPYFNHDESSYMEYQYGYVNLPQYEPGLVISANFITEDQKQIISNINKSITNDVTNDAAYVKKLIYTLWNKEDLQEKACKNNDLRSVTPEKVYFVKEEFDKRLDRIEAETGVSTEERKRKFSNYANKVFNNQRLAKKKKSQ